ncbi:hypothetical protein ACJIZ3_008448 [Penstemon smallii]|uniref:Uncharacterized protein n=1 Tax=Penstemon smallii TaxID=265156 RepID=A0ABD3TA70_9LAMI
MIDLSYHQISFSSIGSTLARILSIFFIHFWLGVNAVGFGRVYMKKLTRPNMCGLSIF